MNGDSRTAPTRPPPGPTTPGSGEPGPGISSQHDSASELAASSKTISSSPFRWEGGGPVISGTHVSKNASMSASADAPLGWLAHGKSWPSLHRFGVMNESFGVLVAV